MIASLRPFENLSHRATNQSKTSIKSSQGTFILGPDPILPKAGLLKVLTKGNTLKGKTKLGELQKTWPHS